MTDTDLRRLAEAATPGPWRLTRFSGGVSFDGPLTVHAGTDPEYGEPRKIPATEADAAYIAAANPQRIRALLDERDEYMAKLGEQIGVPSAAERRVAALEDDLAQAQSDHEWAVGRVAALEEGLRDVVQCWDGGLIDSDYDRIASSFDSARALLNESESDAAAPAEPPNDPEHISVPRLTMLVERAMWAVPNLVGDVDSAPELARHLAGILEREALTIRIAPVIRGHAAALPAEAGPVLPAHWGKTEPNPPGGVNVRGEVHDERSSEASDE